MPKTQCELCLSQSNVSVYEVDQPVGASFEVSALLCEACQEQLADPGSIDGKRWRVLNETMWSENPAVKVLAWRILNKLGAESWAQDLLDQLYLDDEQLEWARSGAFGSQASEEEASGAVTRDCNGAVLAGGDSVTLIKDLDVKGAGFTAKRGTLVKNIALTDDSGLIEGKVNGVKIVLKTEFLKKA